MKAVILSIGSELTCGCSVDTNAAWLSRQLVRRGVDVRSHRTVPDAQDAIVEGIRSACQQAELVIMTGGLGPTPDDLTRQALAETMGVPLERSERHVEGIRAFFAQRGRPMPEANTIQACFPAGSEPIDNACGTAPGIRAACGSATVFALPGVPREMREMFAANVDAFLADRTGGAVLLDTTLHCFGAGESDIAQRIAGLMARDRYPQVGTSAEQGIIRVRVYAGGASAEEAQRVLQETADEIRRRLGTLVYGCDEQTLPAVVGRLLATRRKTVATAESCTGGLVAKMLTDVAGSSAYFLQGVVTYANEAKTALLNVPGELIDAHGAVSAEVAEAMAAGCQRLSGSDIAVSLTGIAGPGGGTADKPVGLVYIGLADNTHVEVTEHRFGAFSDRQAVRQRAALTALNLIRLHLLNIS